MFALCEKILNNSEVLKVFTPSISFASLTPVMQYLLNQLQKQQDQYI